MDSSGPGVADRGGESFLRDALDGTDQLVYVFDAAGRSRWWNATVRERTGLTDAELGRTDVEAVIRAIIAPNDVERAQSAVQRLCETSTASAELSVQTPEGESVPFEFRGTAADAEGESAYLVVGFEIGDRLEHERKVEELRHRTLEMMTATTQAESAAIAATASNEVIGAPLSGVFFPDSSGQRLVLAAATHEAEDAFDTEPEYDRDAPPGSRSAIVWGAYERGEPVVFDDSRSSDDLTEESPARSVIIHPLGDHGVLIVSSPAATAFDDTDQALVDILATSLRASLDRVDREERLRRQNERLDEFASILSHDLRNPLNIAKGHLDLAREAADPEPNFDAVDRSLDRIGTLVEDLLTLAREGKASVETTRVNMGNLARSCWLGVRTGDADLQVDLAGSVVGNESRLRQLFENLFRNSVEHGSTSGRDSSEDAVEHRSTRSQTQSDDAIEHGTTDSGGGAGDSAGGAASSANLIVTVGRLPDGDGFYVADNGVGIPESERDSVLSPGYSTGTDGTGLGLSIVNEAAAAHGWTVSVTESADGGARVEFRGVEWL